MGQADERELVELIKNAVHTERLVETAVGLIEVPSPTRDGGAVANRLEEILAADGFEVDRPDAGWPSAPAVAARLDSGRDGKTLQFDGHLDTVHLPFVAPRVENGLIYGSGSCDMKAGVAAAVEAIRVLKETGLLTAGSVLLTAHDLHEAPWGDGAQLDGLIDEGYVGDGVLIPEYQCDQIAVIGRGLAVLEIEVTRDGEPVHEVRGGIEQPSVILAGAELLKRFSELDKRVAVKTHPMAGRESLFVGQAHGGEIYNQAPTLFEISATRRWLPGASVDDVEAEYRQLLSDTAAATSTHIKGTFQLVRDSFQLDADDPLVETFQSAFRTMSGGALPIGAKPFVDDGNTFSSRAGVPAITHGPNGKGAHTLHEEVPIEELVRVAELYALTAVRFCSIA